MEECLLILHSLGTLYQGNDLMISYSKHINGKEKVQNIHLEEILLHIYIFQDYN